MSPDVNFVAALEDDVGRFYEVARFEFFLECIRLLLGCLSQLVTAHEKAGQEIVAIVVTARIP
ncbi:hypothetical protein NBRC116597_39360 [Phaeobacter sp. NW0010-22]